MTHRFGLVGLGLLLVVAVGCRSGADGVGDGDGAGAGAGGERAGDREDDADPLDVDCETLDCTEPRHPSDVVDPDDPRLDVDPHLCQVDSDCLVGTPRDCCTNFCPDDAVAWSHAAWLRYQEECAVEECAVVETLACRPEALPGTPPTARCVQERCVLR
jgi:hypothetical protein